ncbi:unnamed protein product [Scytosiphon promiscuus]
MSESPSGTATQDRTVLHGLGERLLKLVTEEATNEQWAEWLRTPLEHAFARGDQDLAQCLLKAGVDGGAGWKGLEDRTLLQAAAEGGNKELVATVLERGGLEELDAVSGEGEMTALHRASEGGHTAVAKVLMVEGANVGLLDARLRGVLHYAAEQGSLDLVEYLMIARVDLNVKDVEGDTPLHLAAACGNTNVISTLLRRGASIEAANDIGQHALHLAVENGHFAAVEELLRADADPSARYGDDNSNSPLRLGVTNTAMTRALLEHGADVDSTDDVGFTALHYAASDGGRATIESILEAGADLEARSSGITLGEDYGFIGLTPLHVAAYHDSFEAMDLLLQSGATINAKDDEGLTPLHVVCKTAEFPDSVKSADFLLRRGANEMVFDDGWNLPIDLVENSDANSTGEKLRRLLINAPADRAWRRRGNLVMCRSRLVKIKDEQVAERSDKILRHGNGTRIDAAAASCDLNGDSSSVVLQQVVKMHADVIFRKIIFFL